MTLPRLFRYAIAGVLLAWLLLFATDARCAVWVRLIFTATEDIDDHDGRYVSGVGRYRIEFQNGTSWDSVRIYRVPGAEGVPVKVPGERCTLYVSQTVTPLTSRTYRLASIDDRGNRSPVSNFAIWATGFPDTIAGLSRPVYSQGHAFKRTFAQPVGWTLQPGDSATIRAVHQEQLQLMNRGRLCQLYGRWALRGVQQPCP